MNTPVQSAKKRLSRVLQMGEATCGSGRSQSSVQIRRMLPTIVVTVLLLTIAAVTLNGYVQDPHRDHAVASMAGTALTRTSFNTLATESAASAGIGASPETVSSASGASIEADKNFICEETWGIFPCSSHAIGSIVLMCPPPSHPFIHPPTHPPTHPSTHPPTHPPACAHHCQRQLKPFAALQVYVCSLHVGGLYGCQQEA